MGYRWRLEVAGERARYFACMAVDACTHRSVELPAKSVLATKTVHRTRPTMEDGTSGEEVDVVEITVQRERSLPRGGMGSDPRGIVVQ